MFALGAHNRHDARGFAALQNGCAAEAFRGARRNVSRAQTLASLLQNGTDEQRLPGAEDVLGQPILDLARAFRPDLSLFHFEFEADVLTFLKRYVKFAGFKDLSQLLVNRAQDFVLVETRADGLANLSKELIFLGAALRVVHDHIIFQGQPNLQSQTNQQPQIRGTKHAAFGVGKNDHAEAVLASL